MNHKNGGEEIVYNWAAKALSPYVMKFRSKVFLKNNCLILKPIKDAFEDLLEQFKDKDDYEILTDVFEASQENNPFLKSDFVPYKLVSAYSWICK